MERPVWIFSYCDGRTSFFITKAWTKEQAIRDFKKNISKFDEGFSVVSMKQNCRIDNYGVVYSDNS